MNAQWNFSCSHNKTVRVALHNKMPTHIGLNTEKVLVCRIKQSKAAIINSLSYRNKGISPFFIWLSSYPLKCCFISCHWCLQTMWDANNAEHARCPPSPKNNTVTHSSIWIFMSSLKQLTVASFPTSEPQRWRKPDNYEFYRQILSVHEWSHSGPWMGLCVTLIAQGSKPENTSELSHEVKTED